jgi:glycosyltransferase involved in cell wall biosynthesis
VEFSEYSPGRVGSGDTTHVESTCEPKQIMNPNAECLRVLLYNHTFLPKVGGREIVIYQLARALTRLGHDVRIAGPQGYRSERSSTLDVRVRRYPRFHPERPLTDPIAQFLMESQMLAQLALEMVRERVDVIHAHTLYPAGYVATRLRVARLRRPLVLTPHGIDINTAPDQGYGMRLDNRLRAKIDVALDRCDRVTAISEGVFDALVRAGVPTTKISKVGNGVDLKRFHGSPRSDVRRWLGVPENANLILTVGNYTPLKGHEDLIRAMPAVLAKAPFAYAVIVGKGTEHLATLAESLGVSSHVRLPGSISGPIGHYDDSDQPDQLADLYRSATVYVSVSNREGAEGLSLSVLDAMASGLPVIGTDITGNRDVIKNQKNGLLIPPGDTQSLAAAISRLVSDTPLQQAYGNAARCEAQRFEWDMIALKYVDTYRLAITEYKESASRR